MKNYLIVFALGILSISACKRKTATALGIKASLEYAIKPKKTDKDIRQFNRKHIVYFNPNIESKGKSFNVVCLIFKKVKFNV